MNFVCQGFRKLSYLLGFKKYRSKNEWCRDGCVVIFIYCYYSSVVNMTYREYSLVR